MSDDLGLPSKTIEEAAVDLKLKPEQVKDLLAAGALEAGPNGVSQLSLMKYLLARASSDMQRLSEKPSALKVASAFLGPLVLGSLFFAACIQVFSVRDHKPMLAFPWAVLVFGGGLLLAWWLARTEDALSTVNGIGTKLYGRRMTDKGRVGSMWLVFIDIPLLPIRSYVILEETEMTGDAFRRHGSVRLSQLPGIHWPHVIPLLLGVWGALGAVIAYIVLH